MMYYTRTYCPVCGRWFDGRNGNSIKIATCWQCTVSPSLLTSMDPYIKARAVRRDTHNRLKVQLAEEATHG